MTINELQASLIKEIERITQDMELINRKGEHAELKGYQHAIPFFSVIPDGADSEGGLLLEDDSANSGGTTEDEMDLFPYLSHAWIPRIIRMMAVRQKYCCYLPYMTMIQICGVIIH